MPVYHFDKASVVVSLDADFLCGPGSVRYQKDFAGARRVTDERKDMNRLYVVESTPSLTGSKADHRLAMRAADVEAFARELAGSVGAGGAAATAERERFAAGRPGPVEVDRGAGEGSPGAPRTFAGRRRSLPARCRARARAGDESGAWQRRARRSCTAPSIDASAGRAGSLNDLVTAMDAGQVDLLVISAGEPGLLGTRRPEVCGTARESRHRSVYHGLYTDETAYLSHWNVARHPPARNLGRRACPRRHRDDHPAAHRAPVRGTFGLRAAVRVHVAARPPRLRRS